MKSMIQMIAVLGLLCGLAVQQRVDQATAKAITAANSVKNIKSVFIGF